MICCAFFSCIARRGPGYGFAAPLRTLWRPGCGAGKHAIPSARPRSCPHITILSTDLYRLFSRLDRAIFLLYFPLPSHDTLEQAQQQPSWSTATSKLQLEPG